MQPSPQSILDYFFFTFKKPLFWAFLISGNYRICGLLCLFSLIMFSIFNHFVACTSASFLFVIEGYSLIYVDHKLVYPIFRWQIFGHFDFVAVLIMLYAHKFLCGHVFSFLLGVYLGVELLDYMVILRVTSRNRKTIYSSQLGGCEVVPPLWFWFTFPWRLMLRIVSCAYRWPWYMFFKEMSVQILCSF